MSLFPFENPTGLVLMDRISGSLSPRRELPEEIENKPPSPTVTGDLPPSFSKSRVLVVRPWSYSSFLLRDKVVHFYCPIVVGSGPFPTVSHPFIRW